MNIGWIKVFVAAVLEIIWITGLKYSVTYLDWGITFISWLICSYCFITASSVLPVGTSYCVFTGLGALGTVLVEVFYFGMMFSITKILLIILLMTGIIGLKICTDK